jgi:hypothetical protein
MDNLLEIEAITKVAVINISKSMHLQSGISASLPHAHHVLIK